MSDLRAPFDGYAESVIAGCATASRRGARLAQNRLAPDDFWDPRLRRIFEAALDIDDSLDGISEDSSQERLRIVADRATVPLPDIRRLVSDRPVQWDTTGTYADKIARAAQARKVMALCAQIYNDLGAGTPLHDITPKLAQIEKTAAG